MVESTNLSQILGHRYRERLHAKVLVCVLTGLVLVLVWPAFQRAVLPVVGYDPMELPWGDARVITAGAEARSNGLDPLVENPDDHWNRPCNYPRVVAWAAEMIGLRPGYDAVLGIGFGLAMLAGITVLAWWGQALKQPLFIIALLSPTTLLALERGNLDNLIFGLLCVACLGLGAPLLAIAIVALCVLKLFPVFALIAGFTDYPRLRLWPVACLLCITYGVYLALTGELALIRAQTPRIPTASWGADTLAMRLRIDGIWLWSGYLVGVGALFFGASVGSRELLLPNHRAIFVCALAGAGIFVGCFFLGTNFDYHLIFLFLLFPAVGTSNRPRLGGTILIFALWANLLHIVLVTQFHVSGAWVIREMTMWATLALCSALIASIFRSKRDMVETKA